MLSDLERKMLRILYNFSLQKRRMPTTDELIIKTGRRKTDIYNALVSLEQSKYLIWEDKSNLQTILILEGWERENINSNPKPTNYTRSIDYWTQY